MNNAVLLDTGCIVALLDRAESHHLRCVQAIESLTGTLVTCEPVIAEACYLLRDVHGAPDAVLENVEIGTFKIPIRLIEATAAVRVLLKRYRNVPMDFADACLVHLATAMNCGRILTLDRDFSVYRWGRGNAFENLVDLDPPRRPARRVRA